MQNPVREAAEALMRARDTGTMESEADAFDALRAALALPAPEPDPRAHARIYLHTECGDFHCGEHECVTWSEDRLAETDIEYVQAPLYVEPPAPQEVWCACGDQITPESGAECGACITARAEPPAPEPIPMLLWCPICRTQHVDTPQPEKGWTNPPHRSHECQACGHLWRVADVATTGVRAIQTKGGRDGTAEPPAPRERSIVQTIDERLGAGWTGRFADALTEADETHAAADSDHEAGK